jgi:hypothetical protein
VAGVIGAEATLVAGGVVGAILMGGLLFYPGVRDPEREPAPTAVLNAADADADVADEPTATSGVRGP